MNPKETGLIPKYELVFIFNNRGWHVDIFLVNCLKFYHLFLQRIFEDKTANTITEENIYLCVVFLRLDEYIQHFFSNFDISLSVLYFSYLFFRLFVDKLRNKTFSILLKLISFELPHLLLE